MRYSIIRIAIGVTALAQSVLTSPVDVQARGSFNCRDFQPATYCTLNDELWACGATGVPMFIKQCNNCMFEWGVPGAWCA
jgi:hypothetical protein